MHNLYLIPTLLNPIFVFSIMFWDYYLNLWFTDILVCISKISVKIYTYKYSFKIL